MTSARNAMRDAALEYAKDHVWSVFPARFIGKQKLSHTSAETSNGNPWGYSKEEDELRAYWARWPNAAIGLPTGAINGIFILETDTPDGHGVDGRESLIQLTMRHGDLPRTREAESPTGSVHHYYKQPPGLVIPCSASKLGPGIDVRGDGGFVIAPPSVRPKRGQYKWISHCAIAAAPKWLLDLVAVKHEARPHVPLDPEIAAMLMANAGAGISTNPDDFFPDDPDLELKIQCALTVIPADDYYVWLRCGAAIYDGLGDAGFELFDAWSRTSDKYEEASCKRKWRDVSHMRWIHAATIFHYADEYDRSWRDFYQQELREVVA